ncbi:hypothetical protein ACTXJ1_10195 [Brachybacterium alimentarium]
MSTDPFDAALAEFRSWDGWTDDDYPEDDIRVPLEEAIDAYLRALRGNE